MRPYLLQAGLGVSEAHGGSPSESDAVLAKDTIHPAAWPNPIRNQTCDRTGPAGDIQNAVAGPRAHYIEELPSPRQKESRNKVPFVYLGR
jgi:hypothetical protein